MLKISRVAELLTALQGHTSMKSATHNQLQNYFNTCLYVGVSLALSKEKSSWIIEKMLMRKIHGPRGRKRQEAGET
jgi:hypothetical protein